MVQFYTPKPRPQKATQPIIKVKVDGLDAFGQGIAHLTGKTLFINGALPGEEVEISIVEEKRHYAKAKVVKRFNDSPYRIKPLCRYFNQCGGCQQQHIQPEQQRQSKLASLLHLLERQTVVKSDKATVLSAQPYHYRRRVRLGVRYDAKLRRLKMGFRQASSNDLVEIDACPVMQQSLSELIVPLRECLSSLQTVSQLGHVELVAADNGVVMVLRHLSQLTETDRVRLTEFAEQHRLSLYIVTNDKHQALIVGQSPYYSVNNLTLYFNPQGFIQVNSDVNRLMIEKALSWLELTKQDRVLDLFCGVGNFTLPMAQEAANVVGVEGVNSLVALATGNAIANRFDNVQFYHENLAAELSHSPWARGIVDKVLLDPARAGAIEVMPSIVKLSPRLIVYVSCNPATLVRDSQVLLKAGYQLDCVTMIDMFPNTEHLESMILFKK